MSEDALRRDGESATAHTVRLAKLARGGGGEVITPEAVRRSPYAPADLAAAHATLRQQRDELAAARADQQQPSLQEQLEHAQKLSCLGVLASGIAHDFNNLLTGMLGNANLAREALSTDSPALAPVRNIERSALRAAELTRQMLAYAGKADLFVQPIDVSQLVQEMGHLLAVSVSKKVTLEYDCPEGLRPIEADATRVRQVVMNLITNASEAIAEDAGRITIRTGMTSAEGVDLPDSSTPADRFVFVEVADTGCGMDAPTKTRIFDPFFTKKAAGRGLGLAAVLGIVRSHGGAVHVDSDLGRGTRIRVMFPAAACLGTPAAEAAPSRPTPRGSGTILVVDDEEAVRWVAKASLERSGFAVLTASDGCAALDILRERSGSIDAVVLDLMMPRMGGDAAFREMQRIGADVPVILTSGYDEQDARAQFGETAPAGFVQKPYLSRTLVECLQAAISV